jgi:glutaconate CoA-transferase subunit B
MSAPAGDWTVDELMVARVASLFTDGDQVVNGMASFVPVCAFMLARRTHAPNLVWLAGAVGLDPRPTRVPASTLESALWRDAVMYVEQYEDFWSWALKPGLLTKFMVRGAQIDMHGNANNSAVGADYHRPKVRLPGTAGMGDMGSVGKRLFYWSSTHDPRTFVERVDWVSCAGWLDGGDRRERLGLAGGPELVVTNLAVMDFAPGSRRMRLCTVHPGVSVEQVQAATGFELLVADDLGETPAPTTEEVRLIREEIDPDGVRKSEFRR